MALAHGARQVKGAKILLIVSSFVCLFFLGLAAYEDNLGGAWRTYQREYRARLSPDLQESFRIDLKQNYLPELHRVDRCITCHVAVEDPKMVGQAQPLATHSGTLLKDHPPEKFGCTLCHEGQGRAVTKDAAHGHVPHWNRPLLSGTAVHPACGKCHSENDLFGAESDFYKQPLAKLRIHASELAARLRGAESIGRGKALVAKGGCLGCHAYRGKGGTLGPEITYVGDKPPEAYDYSHLRPGEPHTPRHWLLQHFLHPSQISPGTAMPSLGLGQGEAEALTDYVLSLKRRVLPAPYLPVPSVLVGPPLDGKGLFHLFCAACHGQGGKHGLPNPNSPLGSVPALNYLAERLNLFEPKDAALVIARLKSGLSFEAWKKKPPFETFPQFLEEFERIRTVLKTGIRPPKKDPKGPPPPLRMPAFGNSFSDEEVNALIAYIIEVYPWDEDD